MKAQMSLIYSLPLEGGGLGWGWRNHREQINPDFPSSEKESHRRGKSTLVSSESKHIEGIKFRRQAPIGDYIVDFVAFDKRLVIEVDGGQHAEDEKDNDMRRDAWLRSQGFKVLRF